MLRHHGNIVSTLYPDSGRARPRPVVVRHRRLERPTPPLGIQPLRQSEACEDHLWRLLAVFVPASLVFYLIVGILVYVAKTRGWVS